MTETCRQHHPIQAVNFQLIKRSNSPRVDLNQFLSFWISCSCQKTTIYGRLTRKKNYFNIYSEHPATVSFLYEPEKFLPNMNSSKTNSLPIAITGIFRHKNNPHVMNLCRIYKRRENKAKLCSGWIENSNSNRTLSRFTND